MNEEFDEVVDIAKRHKLEETLSSIKGFFGTRIHQLFVAQTKEQLDEVSDILLDPATRSFADLMELKGQRLVLLSNLTLFEDAAQTLEDRIQKLLDLENQTEHNENQE